MKAWIAVGALLVAGVWQACAGRLDAGDARLRFVDGVLTFGTRPFCGVVLEHAADGRVTASTCYQDGLRDGEQLRFDVDGSVLERRGWRRGLRQGVHAGWFVRTGRPRFCYVFDRDLSTSVAYEWADLPGSPIVGRWQYEGGREVGMQRIWRVDGIVRASYLASDAQRYGLQGKKECSR